MGQFIVPIIRGLQNDSLWPCGLNILLLFREFKGHKTLGEVTTTLKKNESSYTLT